jgi:hypothetical protein
LSMLPTCSLSPPETTSTEASSTRWMRARISPACHGSQNLRHLTQDFGKNVDDFLKDSAFFMLWTSDYEGPT